MSRFEKQAVFHGLILLSVILLSCAKVVPPPGGPVDKTGASIISTFPENGTIQVNSNSTISIEFSENMDRKLTESAIFVTPRFVDEPEFKWKGKTLEIIPHSPLRDSTTHVINVGSGAKDLRGNLMDKSYVFAFSTGLTIDRGKISGTVTDDGKPVGGITIGLYDIINPDQTTNFDSLYPPFMTQSGKDGKYKLEYLPEGEFFMLAFQDDNSNQLFNLPKEKFGVTDRPIAFESGQSLNNINFSMTSMDTSKIAILLAAFTSNHLIRTTFSRNILVEKIEQNLSSVSLIRTDSVGAVFRPKISLPKSENMDNSFDLYFGDLNPGKYQLKISTDIFTNIPDSTGIIESDTFDILDVEDSKRPKVEYMSHHKQLLFAEKNRVVFHFSEPVDTNIVSESLMVVKNEYDIELPFSVEWPNEVSLIAAIDGLEPGLEYYLDFNREAVKDLSGNPIGDSLWGYRFRTYNTDSLGTVSGTVHIGPEIDSAGSIKLVFLPIRGKNLFEYDISGTEFNQALPPGKYFLHGYIDRNHNDREDKGSLFPFVFSESRALYPDTIKVRARFETAGIDFRIE